MQGKLMAAQLEIFNQGQSECFTANAKGGKHLHQSLHYITQPYPEAFLVNLNYSHVNQQQASAKDILALMLSVPESFRPKQDLYGVHDGKKEDTEFILRGLIVFSGNHYVTYIRSVKSKLAYVLPMDNNK